MTVTYERREYDLPADDVPPEVRERLHPWIAGFIGLKVEAANERIAERWNSVKGASLRALRDTLVKFDVDAIADFEEGGMIRAYRKTSEEPGIGDYWYLPGPLEPAEITRRLIPSGLEGNDDLRRFLIHFAGLAEDIKVTGNFVYSDDPWPLFTQAWGDDIEGINAWKGSLILFQARNGCSLLVRKGGEVAWWILQEGRIERMAKTFDQFVKAFNKHRKLSWPFDPYGP